MRIVMQCIPHLILTPQFSPLFQEEEDSGGAVGEGQVVVYTKDRERWNKEGAVYRDTKKRHKRLLLMPSSAADADGGEKGEEEDGDEDRESGRDLGAEFRARTEAKLERTNAVLAREWELVEARGDGGKGGELLEQAVGDGRGAEGREPRSVSPAVSVNSATSEIMEDEFYCKLKCKWDDQLSRNMHLSGGALRATAQTDWNFQRNVGAVCVSGLVLDDTMKQYTFNLKLINRGGYQGVNIGVCSLTPGNDAPKSRVDDAWHMCRLHAVRQKRRLLGQANVSQKGVVARFSKWLHVRWRPTSHRE
jgi:hypothetical protein